MPNNSNPYQASFNLPPEPIGEWSVLAPAAIVDNLFFQAVEETMAYTADSHDVERRNATYLQISYASGLASIGYLERSEASFDKALEAISSGAAFAEEVFEGKSPLMESPEFLRTQAKLYAHAANSLYVAGFVERAMETADKAEEAIRLAILTPNTEGMNIPDIGRGLLQPRAVLGVSICLAGLGLTDRAEDLRTEAVVNEDTYQMHIEVLEALKEIYDEREQYGELQVSQDLQQSIIDDIQSIHTANSQTKPDSYFDSDKLKDFTDFVLDYDLEVDVSENLDQRLHEIDQDDFNGSHALKADSYVRLAGAYLSVGDQDGCRTALAQASLELKKARIFEPNEPVDGDLIDQLANAYLRIGEDEIAESIMEGVPSRFMVDFRMLQAAEALRVGDGSKANLALCDAERELYRRFSDPGDLKLDDFDFGCGIKLATRYLELGNFESMDRVYTWLEDREKEMPYKMMDEENGPYNLPIASAYVQAGNLAKALNIITLAESIDQAAFVADMMLRQSANSDPDASDFLVHSEVLTKQLREYIDYRRSLIF